MAVEDEPVHDPALDRRRSPIRVVDECPKATEKRHIATVGRGAVQAALIRLIVVIGIPPTEVGSIAKNSPDLEPPAVGVETHNTESSTLENAGAPPVASDRLRFHQRCSHDSRNVEVDGQSE
jgi:hypothetical protein